MAGQQESNAWLLEKLSYHQEHGAHEDVLADTSEENLDFIWHKWASFCGKVCLDPKAALSAPESSTIKTFFDFMNQNGTAQAISNQTYFRRLKQHIKRISGQDLDASTCRDVNAYIKHHLGGQKKTAPRERPVASAQDFIAMLRFLYSQDTTNYPDERQRVQQAFLMQIMAYSALRPSSTTAARKRKRGAGNELKPRKQASPKNDTPGGVQREDSEAVTLRDDMEADVQEVGGAIVEQAEVRVKYGDFRLFLMLDNESDQVRLAIQPQYKHYKGEKRRQQLKTFTYWTMSYVLACPAATLLALALHDGALQDIKTLDDLLKLRVPPNMGRIELYWSDEWYDCCIMRESSYGEPHKELSSTKARYRFRKLGENMGLQQRFVAYCLRRFCLNLISVKAGPQVRRHVAGHTNDEIYEDHYIDQRIGHDITNLVLGNPTEERLTATLHRMTAGADPSVNAPLPQEVDNYIKTMPDMVALLARRREINDTIGRCELEATLSDLREQRKRCTDKIRARKQHYIKEYRKGHFKRRDQGIVRAQLDGHGFDDVVAACQPTSSSSKTYLAERSCLGKLDTNFLSWSPTVAENWSEGLRLLQNLCGRVEGRTDYRRTVIEIRANGLQAGQEPLLSAKQAHTNSDGSLPYRCAPTQCLHCLCNQRLQYSSRVKEWQSMHTLWRHVRTQHLSKMKRGEETRCPHPACSADGLIFNNMAHFLNHAQVEHGVRLQRE